MNSPVNRRFAVDLLLTMLGCVIVVVATVAAFYITHGRQWVDAATSRIEPVRQAQMLCPDPRYILQVRCPGPHEITGPTMSCKKFEPIDNCAQGALGD